MEILIENKDLLKRHMVFTIASQKEAVKSTLVVGTFSLSDLEKHPTTRDFKNSKMINELFSKEEYVDMCIYILVFQNESGEMRRRCALGKRPKNIEEIKEVMINIGRSVDIILHDFEDLKGV